VVPVTISIQLSCFGWFLLSACLIYLPPIYADKSIQFALNFGSFSVLFSCGGVDHGALFDLLNAFRFCWSRSVVVDGLFTIAPIPTPTIRVPRGPFSWALKKLFQCLHGAHLQTRLGASLSRMRTISSIHGDLIRSFTEGEGSKIG
jgi:hypothetical protein